MEPAEGLCGLMLCFWAMFNELLDLWRSGHLSYAVHAYGLHVVLPALHVCKTYLVAYYSLFQTIPDYSSIFQPIPAK